MNYPAAYIEYLVQFHATRDYFECHELLEEYWKEHPSDGLSKLWVISIQIAVAQYHERRENRRGALKMYQSALESLKGETTEKLGLDHAQLQALLEQHMAACQGESIYEDMMLPISDNKLLEYCQKEAAARGLSWGQSSAQVSQYIIHRHTRRDRSDVIAARNAALQAKRKG